jgi:hypothetical protein
LSGSLQQKFNEVVHGAEASDIDLQSTKAISVYEVLKLLLRFAYHVFIRGATYGINSMLQAWALLVLISAPLRFIAIPDVDVINTALMILASLSFLCPLPLSTASTQDSVHSWCCSTQFLLPTSLHGCSLWCCSWPVRDRLFTLLKTHAW